MPPRTPNNGGANRVGISVGYEDSGDSTLQYLREVDRLMTRINQSGAGHPPPAAHTGQAQAREQAQAIETQDRQGKLFAEAEKRRVTDVTNHRVAEGRRASDELSHAIKKDADMVHTHLADIKKMSDEALQQHYLGQRAAGNLPGAQMALEESARRQAVNINPYAPGGPRDPNSPENRAAVERNMKLMREAGPVPPPGSPVPEVPTTIAVAKQTRQKRRAETQEEEDARYDEQYARRQRKKAYLAQKKLEEEGEAEEIDQQAAWDAKHLAAEQFRESKRAYEARRKTVGQGVGEESESDIAYLAEARMRKKRMNERINAKMRGAGVTDDATRPSMAMGAWQTPEERAEAAAWYAADRERPYDPEGERRVLARNQQQVRENMERDRVKQVEDERKKQMEREQKRRVVEELRLHAKDELGPEPYERELIESQEAQRQRRAGIRGEVGVVHQTPQQAIAELDKMRDKMRSFQTEMGSVSAKRMGTDLGQEAGRMSQHLGQVQARMRLLREELSRPADMRRTQTVIEKEMQSLRNEFARTTEAARVMKIQIAEAGPAPTPERAESPWAQSPRARGLFGLGGHGGFGSAIATMAMYGGLYKGISVMKDLTSASIENAKAQSAAEVMLSSATQQAGLLAGQNEGIVKSLMTQAGMSRTLASEATAATTRFATSAGLPGEESRLAKQFANIGAAREVAPGQMAELIDQASKEQGRFAQHYLGVSTETIYRQYAERHRTELEAGYPEKRTTQQNVASLSDLEKRRALIEAIEDRQGTFANAQAERQATVAGQIDRTSAAWDDITASMGQFVLTSTVVIKDIEALSAVLGFLSPTRQAKGTGIGGMITQADMARQSEEFRTSQSRGLSFAGQATMSGLLRSMMGGIDPYGAWQNRSLLPLIPGVGGFIGAYQAQRNASNQEEAENDARLNIQRQAAFGQLQKAGRVIYKDAGGKEYTQAQLDALTQEQRQQVMSNFNLGGSGISGQGYRIEGDIEFDKRMKKIYDDRIKTMHELQVAEEKFTYELGHRTNALAKLRQAELAMPQTQERIGAGLDPTNAFVKPMTQLATAAQRVKQEWGGYSEEVQSGFLQIEQTNAALELQHVRIDTNISAMHMLAEARRLELQAAVETTAADERGLTVLEARLRAATAIPQLRLDIKTLGQFRGPDQWETEQMQRWQMARLRGLSEIGVESPGSKARERITDAAMQQFVGQFPIDMLRNAGTPLARELRSAKLGLDQRAIYRAEEDIQTELKKAEIGAGAAREAQKEVDALARMKLQMQIQGGQMNLGQTARESYMRGLESMTRQKVLAITGELSEKELTPELRRARIDALKEEGLSKLRMETQAQMTRQQTLVFTAQILAEIQEYRKSIGQLGAEGYQVSVKVENDTLARVDEKSLRELNTGFAASQEKKQKSLYSTQFGAPEIAW